MRSSAPNLIVAGWAGSFGVDNDDATSGVAVAAANLLYSNVNAWLLRDVRNLSDRRIATVSEAGARFSDEKPVFVFEIGARIGRRINTQHSAFVPNSDGWAPTWFTSAETRHFDCAGTPSFAFYAVDGNGLGVVRQAAMHSTAGGVVDAAVEGGRLLDIIPAVDRIPVSWVIQPNERVFCVARVGQMDGSPRTFAYAADVYAVGEVQP